MGRILVYNLGKFIFPKCIRIYFFINVDMDLTFGNIQLRTK